MPPSLILSHLTTFPNLSQPSRRWNGESEEKGFSLLRKMITLGTSLSCLTKVRPSVSTDGREAAEAEARGVGFPLRDSMKKECSFGPRFPTHPGAQLGDGLHSPVGWWAARITAGLYGSQNAKSSRTKPPDTRPRGQPPPRNHAEPDQFCGSKFRKGAKPRAGETRQPLCPAATPRIPVAQPP